jgi:ubiquinone/menaquinone biosynthesis C-methylase UbiE
LYHLPDASDREQAARELARVLAPGGVAFIAPMPRLILCGAR